MSNVANVLAGKPLATGGVLVAPLGTGLPEDATESLDVAFKALGYVSEEGLTETTERATEKIKAWGGDTVKIVQTDFSVTYSFTLYESLNSDVLKTIYGDDNVTTTNPGGSTLHEVKIHGEPLPAKAFVFEVKDGDARIRIAVPNAQVTELGEITYSDESVVGYPITIEALRDSDLGANAVKFIDAGAGTSI